MVKVKALKNCKFGYLGQMHVFKIGEEREIDVPVGQIDIKSFEILDRDERTTSKKKTKKEGQEINEGGE